MLTGVHIGVAQEPQVRPHLSAEARQGIELLSLSVLELNEHIANSLEENVFLEHDERDMRKHPLEPDAIKMNIRTESLLARMRGSHAGVAGGSYGEIRREFPFEKYMTEQQTLVTRLGNLLAQELHDSLDMAIGDYLVGNIDTVGYLRIELDEVAARFEVSHARVERVLRVIQACAPAGIGARDVEECLLLQLEAAGQADDLTRRVIKEHLFDLAAGRFVRIAAELGVGAGDIQRTFDLIRGCDPHPGLQFSSGHRQVVCSEAVVERDGAAWVVRMQDFDLPQLKLSEEYLRMLDDPQIDKQTSRYLSKQLRAAQGLMTGIEQRKLTIFQIASCIVARQQEFFDRGIEHLQPLIMAQVAAQVGVSESTVSRVVNGKYLQTPRGTLEMRYFFHSGVDSATREGVSSQTVRRRIQGMIADEDPAHPLSDQELQNQLAVEGIKLSRRTVNKYRTSLNIPSRVQRKRHD
jgi:RNA polymerase sigma-54 factor